MNFGCCPRTTGRCSHWRKARIFQYWLFLDINSSVSSQTIVAFRILVFTLASLVYFFTDNFKESDSIAFVRMPADRCGRRQSCDRAKEATLSNRNVLITFFFKKKVVRFCLIVGRKTQWKLVEGIDITTVLVAMLTLTVFPHFFLLTLFRAWLEGSSFFIQTSEEVGSSTIGSTPQSYSVTVLRRLTGRQ